MKKRVLIVDDNIIARALLKRMVFKMGFHPLVAVNGIQALNIVTINPNISAIVTDYKMPYMDGIELVKNIRANSKLCHIPIMILSAYLGEISSVDLDGFGPLQLESKPLAKDSLDEFLQGQSTMLIG